MAGPAKEQCAATTPFVATSDLLDGKGGRYFENCAEAEVLVGDEDDPPGGVKFYALDPEHAERLWDISERLIA